MAYVDMKTPKEHLLRSLPITACLLMPLACGAEMPVMKNAIGMDFVRIPPGSFVMGASDDDRDAKFDEKPAHRVDISRPFYLAKTEVTQAQWLAVMGTSAFSMPRSNPFFTLPGMADRLQKPNNPATVSWNDAQDFIARLNQLEGGLHYRLPTEAEWEYAARAGSTSVYFFGNNAKELARYAWFGEDFDTGATHAVGQKEPNAWGIFDMYGNVWEWAQDWYSERYYAKSPSKDSGGPATQINGAGHVVRGGSWHASGNGWRSAARRQYPADYRGISVGFRLVRVAD